MNRREALRLMAGAAAAGMVPAARETAGFQAADGAPGRTGLGLVIYACQQEQQARRKANPPSNLSDPLTFLEYARQLGAGGIQAPLGTRDEAYAKELHRKAEEAGMYVEGIVSPPADPSKADRFEAEMRTAALAGALSVRTVIIPGRRYEYFDSMEKFREAERRGRDSLERAAPVAEKHRVRLAVENHKDHRAAERVELLKRIGSEFVGACVDVGNNLPLMDDPVEAVQAFAPWAFCCHLKDQAVQETEDGFLLADVPLGRGCLDLRKMVGLLRGARPDIRFSLETITREPLRVPCFSEKFWTTFADVPGRELARLLGLIRRHRAEKLHAFDALGPEERLALERSFVRASLDHARLTLEL